MAATSTARNACDAAIWLDDAAGIPLDLSGSSNQVDFALDFTLGEYTVFGACCTYRLECGADATITINAVYTTAADEARETLSLWATQGCEKDARTLAVYFPDKNVGSEKWSGEFRLESYSIGADHNDGGPMPITAVLKPHGCISYTIAAT